jgi:hypothetical protein
MRIAIVGSRDFADLEAVRRYVNSLPVDSVIISGATSGVDQTAEEAAQARGLQTLVFPPDWERHDELSEQRWNRMIIKNADLVTVFWNGYSRGTRRFIALVREMGKPLEVYITGYPPR